MERKYLMGYKIDYLVPQRVLIYLLHGTMETVDIQNIQTNSFRLMDEGVAPIHTISVIDPHIKYAISLPTAVSKMKSLDSLHPNAGWLVQVSDQAIHRYMSTWSMQIVYKNARVHAVKTLREAVQFLIDRDSTLSALNVEALVSQYEAWKVNP